MTRRLPRRTYRENMSENHSEIPSIHEVAANLRCSKAHVYNAINGRIAGVSRLPAIPMGRRKLVRRSSLKSWKAANEMTAANPTALTSLPTTAHVCDVDDHVRSGGDPVTGVGHFKRALPVFFVCACALRNETRSTPFDLRLRQWINLCAIPSKCRRPACSSLTRSTCRNGRTGGFSVTLDQSPQTAMPKYCNAQTTREAGLTAGEQL
jgi:hypothetical protein